MKNKLGILFAVWVWAVASTYAQNFDQYFTDRTLRIDYSFVGNQQQQHIAVDQCSSSPRWYGKRHRLAELPMEGNGQITVRDHKSKQIIYRNSFSTLFQEWLTYPTALHNTQSFENVFLVPMPKDTVDITLDLRNNRREVVTSLTHQVVPTDILIRKTGEKKVTPYTTLLSAKDTTHCIHIAFLAEGYQAHEMATFVKDAEIATEAIFAHEPFKSYKDRFNVIAVQAPSAESGTSIPSKGIWKNTALHSHFDTFYSNRYLTTLHLKDMHDWLAGTPYEHIIVLVNTNEYGGGGILNLYNLSMTHHQKFRPVVVHEFGHSFAGLGDEYAYQEEEIEMYPKDVEPWEKNITTKVDFQNKWENLIGKDPKAGFYEGAGYSTKGVYRAYPDCRMRTNENPIFCMACQQAIIELIKFYTEPPVTAP